MVHSYNTKAFFLLLVYIAFLFYGTLIPFDVSFGQGDVFSKLGNINLRPFYFDGVIGVRMDIVSNFALFFIYGVLFYFAFVNSKKNQVWLFSMCLVSGVSFSVILESLQLFSSSRTSSVTDTIIHTIAIPTGYIGGCIFYERYKEKSAKWLKETLNSRPFLFLLLVYSALLFLDFLLPFDISIQISDICNSLKTINFIPFANYKTYQSYFFNTGSEMALYIILGFLVNLCFIKYTSLSKARGVFVSIISVLIFSIIVEITQIFFISRVTDTTDLITAVLGATFGVVISLFSKRQKLIIAIYALFVFYYTLMPFRFSSTFRITIDEKNLIPFYAYWENTTVFAFQDLIKGIVLFLPLGFLIARRNSQKKNLVLFCIFYGIVFSLCMEVCQLFAIGRYFDVTDVMLAGIGAGAGSLIYLTLSRQYLT